MTEEHKPRSHKLDLSEIEEEQYWEIKTKLGKIIIRFGQGGYPDYAFKDEKGYGKRWTSEVFNHSIGISLRPNRGIIVNGGTGTRWSYD